MGFNIVRFIQSRIFTYFIVMEVFFIKFIPQLIIFNKDKSLDKSLTGLWYIQYDQAL